MASIGALDYVKEVRAGKRDVPVVIAIAGDEAFLREVALSATRDALEGINVTVERVDQDAISGEELVRRLRTNSLFGDATATLVVSKRQGSRQECVAKFKNELLEYFEKPSNSNYLIIDAPTFNGTMAVPKRIKKDFLVVTCPSYKPWQSGEIERQIEGYASSIGVSFERGVAAGIREACAGDLSLCAREIEKLALVAIDRPVNQEDLRAHLRFHGDDESFALCEAVLTGQIEKTLTLGAGMFRENDPGKFLQFMGLLESQLRKLGKLSHFLSAGVSESTALGKAGMNPRSPSARTYAKAARMLDPEALRAQYLALYEADLASKSGASDVGALLMELCLTLAKRSSGSPALAKR